MKLIILFSLLALSLLSTYQAYRVSAMRREIGSTASAAYNNGFLAGQENVRESF